METRMSRNQRRRSHKKPWYKKWWIWVLIVLILIIFGKSFSGGNNDGPSLEVSKTSATLSSDKSEAKISFETDKGNKYTVIDTSSNKEVVNGTADTGSEEITFSSAGKYRIKVERDGETKSKLIQIKEADAGVSSDTSTEDDTEQQSDQTAAESQKSEKTAESNSVPREYKSALKKAESYSKTMHMSKAGIYDQLTSEYGEKFSAEAAQYAVDNLKADYNANALAKAKSYQDDQDMSPEGIRDQLTSDYGEKFTQDEANYAIEHLND